MTDREWLGIIGAGNVFHLDSNDRDATGRKSPRNTNIQILQPGVGVCGRMADFAWLPHNALQKCKQCFRKKK